MARAGRKDRGLVQRKDTAGKPVWYVRLWDQGKERWFGSFSRSPSHLKGVVEKVARFEEIGTLKTENSVPTEMKPEIEPVVDQGQVA